MLRKAKEAAKDKLRSVNAERKRHLHLRPGNAARSSANSAPARTSHMKFSAIDDAFEAALNDEGSQSIFSDSNEQEWLQADQETTSQSGGSLDTSLNESTAEQEKEGSDKINEVFPANPPLDDDGDSVGRTHTEPYVISKTGDVPQGESDDDLFPDDKFNATSTKNSNKLPAGDTPNTKGNEQHHDPAKAHTKSDLFDALAATTADDNGTLFDPPTATKQCTKDYTSTATATSNPQQQSTNETSQSSAATNWPFDTNKAPLLLFDAVDSMEESDDVADRFPSEKEVEHSLTNMRLEDHISPAETPLSSLPSSYEGDHRLQFSGSKSPRESSPFSEPPAENQLDALLVREDPPHCGSKPEAETTTETAPVSIPQATASNTPVLTTSILTPTPLTEHPLSAVNVTQQETAIPDPLKQAEEAVPPAEKEDDFFVLHEDYYTPESSSSTAGSNSGGVKSKPNSSDKVVPVTSSAASGGRAKKKTPPPRPAMSPQLKRKMSDTRSQKQAREEAGPPSDAVRVKVVKPLRRSPLPLVQETVINATPTEVYSPLAECHSKEGDTPREEQLSEVQPLNSEQLRAKSKDLLFEEIDEEKAKLTDDSEAPDLSIQLHLLLSLALYLYYSLNVFPYVSGFFAGFLLLYVSIGTAFVYHAHLAESTGSAKPGRGIPQSLELSEEFVKRMSVDFEKLKKYEHKKFAATLSYNPSTHHPSQRMRTYLLLYSNYTLMVKIQDATHNYTKRYYLDLKEEVSVEIVPIEVAQNRKRRWSKKFPILLSCGGNRQIYLFSPTSREKEDWFRRLRSASLGIPSETLIQNQRTFFAYMQHYFPTDPSHPSFAKIPQAQARKQGRSSRGSSSHRPSSTTRVQFSKSPEVNLEEDDEDSSSISITKSASPHVRRNGSIGEERQRQQQQHRASSEGFQSRRNVDTLSLTSRDSTSSLENSFEFVPNIVKPPRDTDWVNALAARLCWDVWHEQRWKDWVMTRIQKKLIRVKTPSFMEQLHLTDVALGNDMPVINRLISGPKLDLKGIWVYLDVTYSGLFVMTIETKLKFGKKAKANSEEATPLAETSDESRLAASSSVASQIPPQKPPRASSFSSHHQPSTSREAEFGENEIDSGSDDEDTAALQQSLEEEVTQLQDREPVFSLTSPPPSTALPSPSPTITSHAPVPKGRRLKSMMSKITQKVVGTRLVQRAAEKMSSYKLVLTVEVQRLDGIVAINIPPPPTDTVWYGFVGSPQLELVAKPRLGHRQVTLSKVTHWIERKLCELVDKKLVLPEMEDLVIPILNSGLPED